MPLSKAKRWTLRGLLMTYHLLRMASSPWGAHLLFCGRKSTCSWWKAGKIPLGQLKSAKVCNIQRFPLGHCETCLISSWWLLAVKTQSCPLPAAQGGSSCLSLSFLHSKPIPLVLTSSGWSESPQAASHSHYPVCVYHRLCLLCWTHHVFSVRMGV